MGSGSSKDCPDGLRILDIDEINRDTGFTRDQIIHLHKRFKYFDTDHDNRLSREDFLFHKNLMTNPLGDAITHAFFAEGNEQRLAPRLHRMGSLDDKINFLQFCRILARFLPNTSKGTLNLSSQNEKLKFAFRMYDKDRDNYISKDELLSVIHMLIGSDKTPQQLDSIADQTISEADTDKDGKISFEEFLVIMAKVDTEKKMTLKF